MFYLTLFTALKQHDIDYLLVGGLAMNLHGVPRMTMDVDIVIALDSHNLSKLVECTHALGLYPNIPVKLADLASPTICADLYKEKNLIALSLISQLPATPTVDIIIHHPLDFASAYANKLKRDLAVTPVMVASIEDMITMKIYAGRQQDLADVAHLEAFLREPQ